MTLNIIVRNIIGNSITYFTARPGLGCQDHSVGRSAGRSYRPEDPEGHPVRRPSRPWQPAMLLRASWIMSRYQRYSDS